MKKLSFRTLLIGSVLFSALAWSAYIYRGDYYHKQSDQFWYLSLADSMRTEGVWSAQVELEKQPPPTATTGAALLMLPLSSWSSDSVFIGLSFLYLLLHLSTLWPLRSLLQSMQVSEDDTNALLLAYFLSFPITLFSLWPINEGMSFTLSCWYLFLFWCRPGALYLLPAFFSPIFRIHLPLLAISALVYGGLTRDKKLSARALFSLLASASGLLIFKTLFPFHQKGIGQKMDVAASELSQEYFSSLANLFVPESLTIKLNIGVPLGIVIALILATAVFSCLKILRTQPRTLPVALRFGMVVLLVATIAQLFSVTLIARYYAFAYLWMLAILAFAFSRWFSPRFARISLFSLVGANLLFLAAYVCTKSTDPHHDLTEETRSLAQLVRPSIPQVKHICLDEEFELHPRQIYGHFRLPSGPDSKCQSLGRYRGAFAFLTKNPDEFQSALSAQHPSCQIGARYSVPAGKLALFALECPL